eukprot:2232944-Rhodomonas_salina.1
MAPATASLSTTLLTSEGPSSSTELAGAVTSASVAASNPATTPEPTAVTPLVTTVDSTQVDSVMTTSGASMTSSPAPTASGAAPALTLVGSMTGVEYYNLVQVTMTAEGGSTISFVATTSGDATVLPDCATGSGEQEVALVVTETTTVTAVSCSADGSASPPSSTTLAVTEGMQVSISFTLSEGSVPLSDATMVSLQNVFANFFSCASHQVLMTFSDTPARRRLLAVDSSVNVLAANPAEAAGIAGAAASLDPSMLLQLIQSADGLANAQLIPTPSIEIVNPSATSPATTPGPSITTMPLATAAVVGDNRVPDVVDLTDRSGAGSSDGGSRGISRGLTIGLSVAAGVMAIGLVALVVWYRRKQSRQSVRDAF